MYLCLPGAICIIQLCFLVIYIYYFILRASVKTASATLVRQNQLFHFILVIILRDYIYFSINVLLYIHNYTYLVILEINICIYLSVGHTLCIYGMHSPRNT